MKREKIITLDHTTMVDLDADGKPKAHGKSAIEYINVKLYDCKLKQYVFGVFFIF